MRQETINKIKDRSRRRAGPRKRRPFWKTVLDGLACQPAEPFAVVSQWNQQARESYLQAVKGDQHAPAAEGAA